MINHIRSSRRLEDHLMRPIPLPQSKAATKIATKHRLLLNSRQQRLINLLLILHARTLRLRLLLLTLTEKLLLTALLIRLLVPSEIVVSAHFVNCAVVDPLEIYARFGRDYVAGVYAAQGHAIDFEGAGY